MNKFLLLLFFGFLFLFSGCYSSVDDGIIDEVILNETLKIGVIVPTSVPASDYGLKSLVMINYSFNEINEAGGINGQQVELIIRDSRCSRIGGEEAAYDLINNYGVKIIVGDSCSSGTLGASRVTEENKIILITPFAQSHKISDAGDFVFRTISSAKKLSNGLAEKVYDLEFRKILVIVESTDFTISLRDSFIDKFEDLGGEIVLNELYLPEENFIEDRFLRLNELENYDSIFFLAQTSDGYKRIANEITRLDIDLDVQFFGNYFVFYDSNEFYDGTIFSNYLINMSDHEVIDFIERVKLDIGVDYSNNIGFWQFVSSYDLPKILKSAMFGCDNKNTACIRDNLYSVRNFNGVMDLKRIDKNGDGILNFGFFVINGTNVEVLNK
jgi:ABC-type branched-subunit amino acid transport system substrate-binding protein